MGQNQCQECGNWGHNRRGCPAIKEAHARVEAMAKKYGIKLPGREEYVSTQWISDINTANMAANGNVTDTNDEITYNERWRWEELEGRKRAQARKNGRGRTCGFCGKGGHNSRTCTDKKQHLKDCNAMRGLAHRVVAVCLEKAGIVPGALMQFRDWDYNKKEYCQSFALVTGLDWDRVAQIDHGNGAMVPRDLATWFSACFIKVRMPAGNTKFCKIPRNIPQQCDYNYYEEPSDNQDLANPVIGGSVNKDSGWFGDHVTLVSPEVSSIYRYNSKSITDEDLNPIVEKLLAEVGTEWSGC
tara:strand:+ start:662 stop:1558 length:897 start_codon:yes stop_codon:yes gene_type:complete